MIITIDAPLRQGPDKLPFAGRADEARRRDTRARERSSMGYRAFACAVAVLAALGSSPAISAETRWTAASCFPKGSYFSQRFERLIEHVNREGKGKLQFAYAGGAPAVGNPFELVQMEAKGLYDIVACTGSYYRTVLPEADALKLTERSPAALRRNGAIDYVNKLHQEKNLYYLARIVSAIPVHLYLNKRIDRPDLSDLHLRATPVYAAFLQAMGATTQDSNVAQIYSYMENGTVVGFGWPIMGLLPDWHKVIRYRVDPGFYDTDIHVLANYDSWKALDAEQQKFLQSVGLIYEAEADKDKDAVRKIKADQAAQGIEAIVFTGENRRTWLRTARDAGWATVIEESPVHGPKLRRYFAVE